MISVNTGLTLSEGETLAVGPTHLSATDADHPAGATVYRVTDLPNNGVLRREGVELAVNGTFTQDDVNAGRVAYQHGGGESTTDAFTFVASDAAGGSVGGTFALTIAPVNDAPVVATNAGLTLIIGTTKVITPAELPVTDVDNTATQNHVRG